MHWQLFFTLLAGHYLADYGLQTQFMAELKSKVFKQAAGLHALTAHAAIHGLVAGLITHNFTAGLIVALSHWVIDFLKASEYVDDRFPHTAGARHNGQRVGLYGINIDQTLHILVLLAVVLWVV
jgi:tetrahydromethanopterin S-methyltransferase subunit C